MYQHRDLSYAVDTFRSLVVTTRPDEWPSPINLELLKREHEKLGKIIAAWERKTAGTKQVA